MPELHSLTPILSILQGRGQKVALVTDGRMSGASGKVPAAIHVCPEALEGGPIACLRDGDMLRVNAVTGELEILTEGVLDRTPVTADLSAHQHGVGRELFTAFRNTVGPADAGDVDGDPNFPVITFADFDGVQTTIEGTLDSRADEEIAIEIFKRRRWRT